MLKIHSLFGTGFGTFKDFYLPTDKYPLVVIRGKNLDGRPIQSNGSGKSQIVSVFPIVKYAASPSSPTKNTAKDFHKPKSLAGFSFSKHKHTYKVEQLGTTTNVRLRITQDDMDKKVGTIPSAKKKLDEFIPHTPEIFYSTVYINPTRDNYLQTGTKAQRFDFFEKLFGLHTQDRFAKIARDHYNEAVDSASQYSIYKQQYKPVSKDKIIKLTKTVSRNEQKLSKLKTRMSEIYTKLSKTEDYIQLAESKTQFTSWSDSKLKKKAKGLKSSIKVSKKLLDDFRDYEANKKERETKLAEHKDLEKQIKGLPTKKIDRKVLEQFQEKRSYYYEAYQTWAKHGKESVGDLKSLAKDYDPKSLSKVEGRIAEAERLLQKSTDHDGANCTFCGAKLSGKEHKKRVRELREALEKDKDLIKKLLKKKKAWEVLKELPKVDKDTAKKKFKQYKLKVEEGSKILESQSLLQSLESRLKELHIPKKIEKPTDKNKTEIHNEINKQEKSLTDLKVEIERRSNFKQIGIKYSNLQEAKTAHKELKKLSDSLSKDSDKTQNKISKGEAKLLVLQDREKTATRLYKEMKKLKKKAKDKEYWGILAEAFGPKGMRIQLIKRYAQMYINMLNKYSSQVFLEPFKFSAEVAEGQFDIYAKRGKSFSDIWYLSGAESRCFALLSAVALFSLLPRQYRTNLMVLDEIDYGMSKETRNKILFEFLPKLRKIVPNIIMITPNDKKDFYVSGAKEYLVVKKRGISKLVEV